MNRGDVRRGVDFNVWLEKDKCRRRFDEVIIVENPSDEDAARAKIIATSIEAGAGAGAGLVVAMLMVVVVRQDVWQWQES